MFTGTYNTCDHESLPGGELGEIMEEMTVAAARESAKPDNNFFNACIEVEIEQWTPELKRMAMEVTWEEVPETSTTGELEEASYKKVLYLHEDSDYTLLE